MKTAVQECPGCDRSFEPSDVRNVDIGVMKRMHTGEVITSSTYCSQCSSMIVEMDTENLSDDLDLVLRGRLAKPISISEKLVREIAKNLGASEKVEDALVEKCFGKNWTGKCPEGARMSQFTNRDRLVAFVADKLKNLWTLES